MQDRSLKSGLISFLTNPHLFPNSIWLSDERLQIYVRRASRVITGRKVRCLDISNAEAATDYRGKGLFTEWLDFAETEAKALSYDAVYAENILNEQLIPFLLRRKYVLIPNCIPTCAVKWLQRE